MARKPISVVSITSSRLMPSMPSMYLTPRLGIQSAFSTIWKPAAFLSKRKTSGSETRKPARAAMFAQTRIRVLFDAGRNSRTSMPASGVNRTMLSKCSFIVSARQK